MPTGFSPDPGRVDQLPHVRLFQVPLLAGDVPDRALGTGGRPRRRLHGQPPHSCPVPVARRAAWLRSQARVGASSDALIVAFAEPGGTILAGDLADLRALAEHASDVTVEPV